MKRASSEARKSEARATSQPSPRTPFKGTWASREATTSSRLWPVSAMIDSTANGVFMSPGRTAFTRTRWRAPVIATAWVSALTPAFETR